MTRLEEIEKELQALGCGSSACVMNPGKFGSSCFHSPAHKDKGLLLRVEQVRLLQQSLTRNAEGAVTFTNGSKP